MDFNRAGIYAIINKINGKLYVGSSKNMLNRYNGHVYDLKKGKHHSIYLQRSVDKHGLKNFKFKVLELIDDISILHDREQYWLDYYESYNHEVGYNISPSAHGGVFANETKEKIRETLKERFKDKNNHPSYKRIVSKETREKISKANIGNDRSLEAIKKTIEKQRKIQPEDMPIIKEMLLKNTHCNIIAEKYNVNVQTIWRIRQGKHTLSYLLNGGYNEWVLEKFL